MNNNLNQAPSTLTYPEGLSVKDIELINLQCTHQHATSNEQVEGFAKAYQKVKTLSQQPEVMDGMSGVLIEGLIQELAALIEKQNEVGYRITPVTFLSGGSAVDANLIKRAMENFADIYADTVANPSASLVVDPNTLYTEFQKIHPFQDGNGRLGDLLWKMAVKRITGKWPEVLPPDVFGGKD